MTTEDHRDEDDDPVEQSKADPPTRPDRPTPSDDATLAQRGEGANAEFADAPTSMEDPAERDVSARREEQEPSGASGDAPDANHS